MRLPLIAFPLLMLALAACVKPSGNFPPDDKGVRLDSTNLPIVWIEVDGDSIMRDERIQARMTVLDNGEGRLNYADTVAHPGQRIDYRGLIALRYRGNSTYHESPKKSYSFRTLSEPLKKGGKKRKVSLLGMGKDNNWALLASYADKSMLRDLLTREIARPWMEYVPQGRYCELFLDGTYYGVFVLSELVSKGKQRLNLASPGDGGDALTGDYLLEIDSEDEPTYTSRYHPVTADGQPLTDRRVLFQFKSPDYDEISRAQRAYITGRINAMEQAFVTGDYRRHIDVMSFIDYQLVMEFCHNVDAYRLSGKFYKRRDSVDPRFKMALWDTDLAYGNSRYHDSWRTDTWMYRSNDALYRDDNHYMVPFWWYVLNNDPEYTAALKARWAQYRATSLSEARLTATMDSLARVLTAHGAMDRDSRAWPHWGVEVWPNYYVSGSYQDELEYIRQWIARRLAWMDAQLDYLPGQ
ncbi:MAG: CotH kinase family protein [Muribaculaceae bacterium]|nr:CotH kinase family protein [Muribaculaceae bacterium]